MVMKYRIMQCVKTGKFYVMYKDPTAGWMIITKFDIPYEYRVDFDHVSTARTFVESHYEHANTEDIIIETITL